MKKRISNADFVHLHNHSEYSSFDGLNKISQFPKYAKEMGFTALALTDHGNMGGAVKFIQECNKEGIKPIVGVEFYLSRDRNLRGERKEGNTTIKGQPDGRKGNRHLVLIAKNWQGWKNLCTLSQSSWTEGLYIDPRIDIELLAKHSEGLICNSACLSSVVNANLLHDRYDEAKKAVGLFKDIFGEDFHLEVMYHGIEAEGMIIPDIIKLSKEMNVHVCATNDCFVAGTMISTENGVVPIENISKNDYVITHKNRLGQVEFVNQRKVNKTYLVKTVLGTSAFETTEEHPILTVQRIGNSKFTQPNWKKCKELTNNDYLLIHKKLHEDHVYNQRNKQESLNIPEIIGDKYNSDISGNYYITHQGFGGRDGKVKIPTTLKVCDELLFILGRYVAEGYCNSNSHQIGFAANCNEKHIQDRIEKYFAKFGVTAYRPEKNNDCKLVFTSKIFKALFTSLCGIGAENKHLPSIGKVSYLAFSKSQMLKILAAYIEGDGHIASKEGRVSVICASTSRVLAYQISDVLQSLGFVSLPTVRNFAKTKHKNLKANPQKWLPLYVLHMSEIDIHSFLNMLSISRDKTRSTSVSRRKFVEIDDYYAIKVKNVTELNEEKVVYNLQIAQDESYLANFYVVHNCHYCRKEQGKSQELLMCMSTSRCLTDPKRLHFPYHEFYLKSAPEMATIFGEHPHFLTNTKMVADKIDAKDIFDNMTSGMRLPQYKIPAEFATPFDYLTHLSMQGMKRLGWDSSRMHMERLQRELADVKIAWDNNRYDFATYFLIVRDYIKFAKDKNILTGCGRGSGYASVLLRALEISYGPDPVKYDLIWERFLGFDFKHFIQDSDFFDDNMATVVDQVDTKTKLNTDDIDNDAFDDINNIE